MSQTSPSLENVSWGTRLEKIYFRLVFYLLLQLETTRVDPYTLSHFMEENLDLPISSNTLAYSSSSARTFNDQDSFNFCKNDASSIGWNIGATTIRIMTLSITTISIMTLSITINQA